MEQLKNYLYEGDAEALVKETERLISVGVSSGDILDEGLIAGMAVIGEKFKNNEIYHLYLINLASMFLFNFFKCNNEFNEISFSYNNFDHVLIYIICKFHVPTTFHRFDFSPKSHLPKCRFGRLTLSLKASQSASNVLYDIFLLSK